MAQILFTLSSLLGAEKSRLRAVMPMKKLVVRSTKGRAPTGPTARKVLTVEIPVGSVAIPYKVRLSRHLADGGGFLDDIFITKPADTIADTSTPRVPWKRLCAHFIRLASEPPSSDLVPRSEQGFLTRTALLGIVGVASDRKHCAYLRRSVSDKLITASARGGFLRLSGGKTWQSTNQYPPGRDKDHLDLNTVCGIAAVGLTRDSTSELDELGYDKWEHELLVDVGELFRKGGTFGENLAQIRARLEGIRKNANDDTRKRLRFLESASDSAQMHMYQYVCGEIVPHVAGAGLLDGSSMRYIQWAHAVQDWLGGLVPALHPMWAFFMRNPAVVSKIMRVTESPSSPPEVNEFLLTVSQMVLLYRHVVDQVDDNEDGEDPGFIGGATVSAEPPPNHDAEVRDLWRLLEPLLSTDSDTRLFIDRNLHKMRVVDCATKYKCSIGNVTKRATRGRDRLREYLKRHGVDTLK